MKQYAIYLRVSTQKQGAQGLGIEAQRKMCAEFITRNNGIQAAEFMDVESGTHRDRPGLWKAIAYCQENHCSLVIAKLDRLARDVEFTFKVINTGIDIHFTDMPQVNTMILGVFASVAQYERELVSMRTRQALQAKIARGEKTGGASENWKKSYDQKTDEVKKAERQRRGRTKNLRCLYNRDSQAMLMILRNVFPKAAVGEPHQWDWSKINTKGAAKNEMYRLMRDYKTLDSTGKLFRKWTFTDANEVDVTTQRKLGSVIHNLRNTVLKAAENDNY